MRYKSDFVGLVCVVGGLSVILCLLPMNGFFGVAVTVVLALILAPVFFKNSKKKEAKPKYYLDEKKALRILRENGIKISERELIERLSEEGKEKRISGGDASVEYLATMRDILKEYGLVMDIAGGDFKVKEKRK